MAGLTTLLEKKEVFSFFTFLQCECIADYIANGCHSFLNQLAFSKMMKKYDKVQSLCFQLINLNF